MNLQNFNEALDKLRVEGAINLPSLKSDDEPHGRSLNVHIKNDTIYFTRKNTKMSVKADDMRKVLEDLTGIIITTKYLESLGKPFNKPCPQTFFMQLLIYFGVAELSGKNPYAITII